MCVGFTIFQNLIMKGLDLLSVLLILLSWRRLAYSSKQTFEDEDLDYEIATWLNEEIDGDYNENYLTDLLESPIVPSESEHPVRHHHHKHRESVHRHEHHHPRTRGTKSHRMWHDHQSESYKRNKLVRHTTRFLDKYFTGLNNRQNGVDDSESISFMNQHVLQNLTVSQLIENLRGLRARRRRSSIANKFTGVEPSKKTVGTPLARPTKKVAEIDGQIVLGGLMMVHERGDVLTCGPIMPQV